MHQEVWTHIERVKEELGRRQKTNPQYSLRAFARSLNLSPSHLSRIIKGERPISDDLAKDLSCAFRLELTEKEKFLESVRRHRGRLKMEKYLERSKRYHIIHHSKYEDEIIKMHNDWVHFAILGLFNVKDFEPTAQWIAKGLGVAEKRVEKAIARLNFLGLLQFVDGQLVRIYQDMTNSAPSEKRIEEAKRNLQKQFLSKASAALSEVDKDRRHHMGMTCAIDIEKLPRAKKKMQKFFRELTQELETGDKRRLYQMNVAFFPLEVFKGDE